MNNIKFSGEISQECKNYILKQNHKVSLFIWLLVFITMSLILLYIGYKAEIIMYVIPFIILLALWGIVIIVFPQIDTPPKKMEQYYPNKIDISEGEISFENKSSDSYCFKKTIDVKKIIDCGNFYYFKFYFPFNHNCICQKDLITEGTIEKFEELFADKIVRKNVK